MELRFWGPFFCRGGGGYPQCNLTLPSLSKPLIDPFHLRVFFEKTMRWTGACDGSNADGPGLHIYRSLAIFGLNQVEESRVVISGLAS